MMDMKLQKIKTRENQWDLGLVGGMIVAIVGTTVGVPLLQGAGHWADWIISGSVAFMISAPLTMLIADKLDEFVRQRWIKGYYIEDCGGVIKLHGAVALPKMDQAYREILARRPGFKIVEDAFDKFGCTLAAVKATPSELDAKRRAESLGIPVRTISCE